MIVLFLSLTLFTSAFAQDFTSFLTPNPATTSFDVDDLFSPAVDHSVTPDKTHVHYSSLGINHAVKRTAKDLFTVGGRWQKLDLTSDSNLLKDYFNIQAQLGWRRDLGEDKFSFLNVSYGSASDKPFQNGRDGTLSANYIQKFNSRWFGATNFSNNRPFLNNVPLPGFFYVKEMTREKALIIGFPFIYWMTPLGPKVSFRYFGLLPWTHRVKVLYLYRPYLNPYIGFEQNPVSFFRSDREKKSDRFFWFERRLSVGAESTISKTLRLDVSTGMAFDRQFFESKNFSDSKNFEISMDRTYYLALSLRYSF